MCSDSDIQRTCISENLNSNLHDDLSDIVISDNILVPISSWKFLQYL